jgi:hypothetical protein
MFHTHTHYYYPYQFQNKQITIIHKTITTPQLLISNHSLKTIILLTLSITHTHCYYPCRFQTNQILQNKIPTQYPLK